MTQQEFEDALPLYVVGALDRPEREAVESYLLTGGPSARAMLKEYRGVTGLLPYALPPKPAPRSLKATVMAVTTPVPSVTLAPAETSVLQKAGERLPALTEGRSWWPNWFGTPAFSLATVMLVLLTGLYAINLRSQVLQDSEQLQVMTATLKQETTQMNALKQHLESQQQGLNVLSSELTQRIEDLNYLKATLAERETELDELQTMLVLNGPRSSSLRRALAQRDDMMAFLQSPRVRAVSLTGADMARSASAVVLFDPDSQRAIFLAFNLPPPPQGKTYQLWAIHDKPMSAGVFRTDPGEKAHLVVRNVPNPDSLTKFAVSLEPEGGRPQPTGAIYLAGDY